MRRGVAVLTAFVVLSASGVVHGIWAERWSPSPQLRAAVERVEQVPLQVGEWTGNEEHQGKGAAKQAEGKIQNAFGKAKDALKDDTNRDDETNFSHALVRPLQAEQLMDALAATDQAWTE